MNSTDEAALDDTVECFEDGPFGAFCGAGAEEIATVFNAATEAHGPLLTDHFSTGRNAEELTALDTSRDVDIWALKRKKKRKCEGARYSPRPFSVTM